MTIASFPTTRLRRLRHHAKIRDLVRETNLDVNDFVYPLFIKQGQGNNIPIASMPGQYQITLENLPTEIDAIISLHVPAVLLFGIPEKKDTYGSDAYSDNGIVQQAIRQIKSIAPDLLIISDICCCQFTDHGHCGFLDQTSGLLDVNNDKTLKILEKQAIAHAKAGADMLAPSGMIDGMVKTIRGALDTENYQHVTILSYSVKYASAYYGPFRDAAEGTPQFGDRQSYQMDIANINEALREAELDISEGTDIIMVKPALSYLDVVYRLKQAFAQVPLAAYQTSGEYAMIKAAAAQHWLDEKSIVIENMLALKRAGANFIITYFAKDLARWLHFTKIT
jgi:porphobilinogen synthase